MSTVVYAARKPSPSSVAPAHSTLPIEVRTELRSGGEPLAPSLRTTMESCFTTGPSRTDPDFSRVRIHNGERAAAAARAVRARAFSVGSHIVFNAGQYQPDSSQGRQLLAHELAHVSQPTTTTARTFSQPGEASEREADAAANAVAAGRVARIGATRKAIVHRQPDASSPDASPPARRKYLVMYDATDGEVQRQAEQTAKDHGTTAHPLKFEPANLGDLVKQEQPDVIMTFGHGEPDAISMGTGLRVFKGQKTISSELEKAGQTRPIQFVAQACSAGAEKGLMDTLQSTPSLKNYTFVSHSTGGHVTRNANIRVAGGATLPQFLVSRFQAELAFDKESADRIVKQVLVPGPWAEAARDAPVNTVLREISVLGFEAFWELAKIDHPDVANDPAVVELNMTKEARERFAVGIASFRARMIKAVEQEMALKAKKPATGSK